MKRQHIVTIPYQTKNVCASPVCYVGEQPKTITIIDYKKTNEILGKSIFEAMSRCEGKITDIRLRENPVDNAVDYVIEEEY